MKLKPSTRPWGQEPTINRFAEDGGQAVLENSPASIDRDRGWHEGEQRDLSARAGVGVSIQLFCKIGVKCLGKVRIGLWLLTSESREGKNCRPAGR